MSGCTISSGAGLVATTSAGILQSSMNARHKRRRKAVISTDSLYTGSPPAEAQI